MKKLLLLLVIIGAVSVVLFLYTSGKKAPVQQTAMEGTPPSSETGVPTLPPSVGSFSLRSANGLQGKVGKLMQLDLVVDSSGKSITGYDLVLAYDQSYLDVQSAVSLLPSFSVFPTKQKENYIVTGVKQLSVKTPVIFTTSPIVRLSFVPKKAGSVTIQVVSQLGSAKSQMVDEETHVILPKTEGITLEIQ